jgi:hypothetical protein
MRRNLNLKSLSLAQLEERGTVFLKSSYGHWYQFRIAETTEGVTDETLLLKMEGRIPTHTCTPIAHSRPT